MVSWLKLTTEYRNKEENAMKKAREVIYDKDANRITLKGFLGKVLFEIEP